MASYVVLINFTERGIQSFNETTDRAQAATERLEELGGRVKDIYWTIGPYDIVITAEAPDDETVTAWALAISSLGNVRTTTLRAFDRDEVGAIIRKVS
jgi:uncharacterized protein with GYD domain